MQKKITVKEDGRFLVYYHFPATATEEETRVFEEIRSVEDEALSVEKEQPLNAQRSTLDTGGVSHV